MLRNGSTLPRVGATRKKKKNYLNFRTNSWIFQLPIYSNLGVLRVFVKPEVTKFELPSGVSLLMTEESEILLLLSSDSTLYSSFSDD
jgi:hypothetical protein